MKNFEESIGKGAADQTANDFWEPVLAVHNLEKRYKGFSLQLPELRIPKGFSTALIGENGAGKSTLLEILAGIRLGYSGQIDYFQGETEESVIRERIAYTGTGNYFLPHWTIQQVGEVGQLLFDSFSVEKYQKLCAELAVQESAGKKKKDKGISKLSDGMRMKVMLAAAFARRSELLLMDEPASPLDPLMRDKLCDMLRSYLDEGRGERSVFFSTHNIADMEDATDYAVIMEQGCVAEQGFVEDLKEKYCMVKGDREDGVRAGAVLFDFHQNAYGFEGLCLSENVDKLAGLDVSLERPTLSQISVGVMRRFSTLQMGKAV